MKNIKNYYKYINEGADLESDNNLFINKYNNYIKSGDIIIEYNNRSLYLKSLMLYIKDDLELLELNKDLDNMNIINTDYCEKKDGYVCYGVSLPHSIDFGDIVSFNEEELSNLLKMSSTDLKSELKSKYEETFNNESYLDKVKIRNLFSNYIGYKKAHKSKRD